MAQKNSPTINFTSKELKDIKSFCDLNEIDIEQFVKDCFNKGYRIEKYGLLSDGGQQVIVEEKEVIKEVIKEVPVEVEKIVEKEVIKEIEVEIPVEKIVEVIKEVEKPVEVIKEIEVEKEVIKEVPVEVIKEVKVEKEVYITDDEQVKELGEKIAKLEKSNKTYSTKLKKTNSEKKKLEEELSNMEILLEEKPKEVIKEIEVEKIVEKEVIKEVDNKEKLQKLQDTISKLRDGVREKDEKILQLEKSLVELEKLKGPIKGQFMGSSNLNDNLYR